MIFRFQTEKMRKVNLCEGDFDRYLPEGIYKDAATTDILGLNKFIGELRSIVDLPFPLIRSSAIRWNIPKDNTGMFTWIKNEPLTATGKQPKYAQMLHFVAKYFGKIHYLNGIPGKIKIIVWPSFDLCIAAHCKLINGVLTLWKVEQRHTDTGEVEVWRL